MTTAHVSQPLRTRLQSVLLTGLLAVAGLAQCDASVVGITVPGGDLRANVRERVTVNLQCVTTTPPLVPIAATVTLYLTADPSQGVGDRIGSFGAIFTFVPQPPFFLPVTFSATAGWIEFTPPRALQARTYHVTARVDVEPLLDPLASNDSRTVPCTGIGLPDLTFDSYCTPPATVTTANWVNVFATVVNQGQGPSPMTHVNVHLVDQAFAPAGRLLGTIEVPPLECGIPRSISKQLQIPADWPSGQSFFLLLVDPDDSIDEANEPNNRQFLASMACTALPDLEVVDIREVAGLWQPGNPVQVEILFANRGRAPSPAFVSRIHLSADAEITGSDPLVHTLVMEAIPALSERSITVEVTVPQVVPRSLAYVGVILDAVRAVREGREENNWKARLVQTSATMPDLTVLSFEPGTNSLQQGIPFFPTIVVRNNGNVPSPSDVPCGLFLSPDANITAAEWQIGGFVLPSLAPGEILPIALQIGNTLELPMVACYLGVLLDQHDVVAEFEEANNQQSTWIGSQGSAWEGPSLIEAVFPRAPCGTHNALIGVSMTAMGSHTARIEVRLRRAPSFAIALLVTSLSPLQDPLPLPGSGCELLLTPNSVGEMLLTDVMGSAQSLRLMPNTTATHLVNVPLYWQWVGLDSFTGEVWSSDVAAASLQ